MLPAMMKKCVLFYLCITTIAAFTQAKVWNAQELAIGQWDVTLKGGWLFDASSIFPRQSSRTVGKLPVKRRPWGSSLDCSLSLCQDGTFVLAPKLGNDHSPLSLRRLLVRGQWNILSNPYCITDRYYDELKLSSYPRATIITPYQKKFFKSGTLDIYCRVWGRYAKSKTIGRKGWMTHGSLVWKDGYGKSPWHPRRVVASFSAKRASHCPSHEGWEDKEFFGY